MKKPSVPDCGSGVSACRTVGPLSINAAMDSISASTHIDIIKRDHNSRLRHGYAYTGNNNNKLSYEMNGKVLDKVLVEKDLGIMISSDVKSLQQHVVVCNKANRVLGMIRTISYKEQWTMVNLYKSLVRPHLAQCVSVWSPYYQKHKELLERVQHRFTRMIEGFSSLPYGNRLFLC